MTLSGCGGCGGWFAALGGAALGCIAPDCIASADCIAALAFSGAFTAASLPAMSIATWLSERLRACGLATVGGFGGVASDVGALDFAAAARACWTSSWLA